MTGKAVANLRPQGAGKSVIRAMKPLEDFEKKAQELATNYAKLRIALHELRTAMHHGGSLRPTIERAKDAVSFHEMSGGEGKLAACRELMKQQPSGFYTDDGELDEAKFGAYISLHLATLMGSFPTDRIPDPATFSEAMIEDIIAREPYAEAVATACRQVRRTSKFMPSIAEVLDAVDAENKLWERRHDAVSHLPACLQDLRALLTEAEAREAKRQAETEARERAYEQQQRERQKDRIKTCILENTRIPVGAPEDLVTEARAELEQEMASWGDASEDAF